MEANSKSEGKLKVKESEIEEVETFTYILVQMSQRMVEAQLTSRREKL